MVYVGIMVFALIGAAFTVCGYFGPDDQGLLEFIGLVVVVMSGYFFVRKAGLL